MAMVAAQRFDIWLVNLDPTLGSEIKKTRPCLIISPNELNNHLNSIIALPLTSSKRNYPTRIPIDFRGKSGDIVCEQIRTIDKTRLIKRIGILPENLTVTVTTTLQKLFSL